jgi:hypothetical protein
VRSPEAISHHLGPLVGTLRPDRDARRERAISRAITPDGRVRADRLDGFIEPERVPLTGLEFVGEVVDDLDYPSIASLSYQELTVTVVGARANDGIILGGPSNLQPNLWPFAYVSANDTVTVRMHNLGGSATDPSSRTWKVMVVR